MDYELFALLLGALLSISIIASSATVYAQSTNKTSVQYLENARVLLKQVFEEYKNGNYEKAEELAASAYLDNINTLKRISTIMAGVTWYRI